MNAIIETTRVDLVGTDKHPCVDQALKPILVVWDNCTIAEEDYATNLSRLGNKIEKKNKKKNC